MQQMQVLDFSFADLGKLGNDVLPKLDAFQQVDSIFWSEQNKCWIVTDNEAVREGFSGTLPLAAKRHELAASFSRTQSKGTRKLTTC